MKEIYKLISIFIIISILTSAVLFSRAAESSSLGVETQNGKVSDIVSVTLKISGVSLGAITVDIDYDDKALSFQDAVTGAEGSKFAYSSANKVIDKSQIRFSGSVTENDNIFVSGVLMTVNFKILSDIKNIELTAQANAYRADYSKVAVASAIGEIKIINTDTEIQVSPSDPVSDASELISQYKNQSNTVVIKNCMGNVISGSQKVGTGSKIIIDELYEIPIIVMADLNGDGERSNFDYILCRGAAVSLTELSGYEAQAADLNGDGVVDAFDTALMDLTLK